MSGPFNALVDGFTMSPAPAPPPAAASGGVAGPSPSQAGPSIADVQGVPPLRGDHNIPLQVGFLGLAALAIVIGLRLLGFRFSVAGKVGVGG